MEPVWCLWSRPLSMAHRWSDCGGTATLAGDASRVRVRTDVHRITKTTRHAPRLEIGRTTQGDDVSGRVRDELDR
jgi:hypothetical protein